MLSGCGKIVAGVVLLFFAFVGYLAISGRSPSPNGAQLIAEDCSRKGDSPEFISAVKRELRDPSSFDHIQTIIAPEQNGKHAIRMQFGANNGLGIATASVATGWLSPGTCTVLSGPQIQSASGERVAKFAKWAEQDAASARAERDRIDPAPHTGRYIVNFQFSGCPAASDWFAMQDAVAHGDLSVDLPPRCRKLQPGTRVRAAPKGQRETISHNGHDYERGEFEDGTPFWTDGMDRMTVSPISE